MTNGHAQNTWDRGFLIGIITGGVIGAGLALYFAPRAAAELRKRMSGWARNLGDAAKEQHQRASAHVSDAVDEITRKGQTVRDQVADTAVRGAREVELFASTAKPDRRTRHGKIPSAPGSRATRGKGGQE